MSPLPVPVGAVAMATLPSSRLAERTDAPMPEVERAAVPLLIVKSIGSMSHVPERPSAALVVTLIPSSMLRTGAEVSISPPSPPAGADASSFPAAFIVPSLVSRMRPFFLSTVRAWSVPVLLTAAERVWSAPLAVMMIEPPSAMMAWLFSTKASICPRVTLMSTGMPCPSLRSICSPAAMAVVPVGVDIVPWLLTLMPASTTKPPAPEEILPRFSTPPAPGELRLNLPSGSIWES